MKDQPGDETGRALRSLSTYKLAGILALIAGRLWHHRLLTVGEYQRIAKLINQTVFDDIDRAA